MSHEDRIGEGLDFFGCEDDLGQMLPGAMPLTVTPSPIAPNAVIGPKAPLVVTPSPLPPVKDWAKIAADKVKTKVDNLPVALGVGGAAGAVVGGGLGAWLWYAHRLFGGLLGGLVVGPAVGMAAGYGVMKITGKGTGKVGDKKKGKK